MHLISHLKKVHNTKLTYLCYICNAKIARKDGLKLHIETVHEGKKPFKCDLCKTNQGFRYPSGLKSHLREVHGSPREKKLLPCEICKKGFTSQQALRIHVSAVHEGKKPFKCDTCGTCFPYKCDLKSHVEAVHLELKPYVCSECPYKCYQKRDLMNHFEKVHEGKESKPTKQKYDKKDKASHEDEKSFNVKPLLKCNLCGFNTELSMDLKKHLSNHATMKPLFCAMCDSDFKEKIKLKQHIELVHGKKVPLDSL